MRRPKGADAYASQLLPRLESEYPGIVSEYTAAVTEGRDGGDHDRAAVESGSPAARLSLRRASMVPSLFDYQEDLVSQFSDLCTSKGKSNVGLLTLPTGGGKTRTAIVALLRLITHQRVKRALWLAPTKELLSQAVETATASWHAYGEACDIELVRADLAGGFSEEMSAGICFATPQMLASRIKKREVPPADVVVFDEAHHVEAPVFRAALSQMKDVSGSTIIGLSATPGRSDEEETNRLVSFFDGNLLWSRLLKPNAVQVLQRRGILARLTFRDIPAPRSSQLPKASISGRALALDLERFRSTVRLVKRASKKDRVLVFSASIRHAQALETVLQREGVSARTVSAYSTDDHRRETLSLFSQGAVSVVLNQSLLATGYDCPAVRHVVLTTRIGSPILFEQIVGRASRGPLVGGNARSDVWQFEDHLKIHGLPTSYYRYEDFDWAGLR